MREIKFRGKDKFTGTWRFGDLVHNKGINTNGYLYNRVMVGGYEVRPETICQFIGRKDKSGLDLYDGDIINFFVLIDNGCDLKPRQSGPFQGVIKYDDYGRPFVRTVHSNGDISLSDNCMVIGNIFDDKEQIESEETK